MEWRNIPGFPGEYEISDTGECRRAGRVRIRKDGQRSTDAAITLRGHVTDKGYRVFKFGGGLPQLAAHRAVALAFIGPAVPGYEVCHIDGNKLNNARGNLRYDTRVGNQLDRRVNGVGATHGAAHPKTVLADDDVRMMRHLYWIDGVSTRQIGARFGVSKVATWQIVAGVTWTHIPMLAAGNDMIRENAELHAEVDRLTAEVAELNAVCANERGEGEGPGDGWRRSRHMARRWVCQIGSVVVADVTPPSIADDPDAPAVWTWSCWLDGVRMTGCAPTAREAMKAADLARAGGAT